MDSRLNEEHIELAVRGIVFSARDEKWIIGQLVKQGCPDAEDVYIEAKRRVTESASYDQDQEIGVAVQRYQQIIREAMKSDCSNCGRRKEPKTALQAQKELSRIFKITEAENEETESETDGEIRLIREYLEPLFDKSKGASELARLARQEIERCRAAQKAE